jgi:membrane fusion protein (multidrug efflux system)
MRTKALVVGLVGLTAVGSTIACGGAQPEATVTAAPAAMRLAADNVATATLVELTSGPAVSGQLTPAREATVRAQVGGSILSLTVDKGQVVSAGQVLAKISARDLDDAMASAEAAVKSADTALTVAQAEQQRTQSLVKGGALASRDLEQANNMVSNAQAAVAAAKARQRAVWQALDDTTVKAPFAGVVSDRPAHQGDVVTPGTALVTIIDPSSMRLEASVPADQIGVVKPGANVPFRLRGFPGQVFAGKVDRISPTADPVTRQVVLFVSLPNAKGQLIAGLFAEGRVDAETHRGIVVPLGAVDETGPAPTVTRLANGKAERVTVTLGLRQAETERVEITQGLAAGDIVITGSSKGVAPGTAIQVSK